MSHGVTLYKSMFPMTDEKIETIRLIPYASAIDNIMYDIISTRADIAYALSVSRRYHWNLGSLYWKAVKDILKYLRRTKNLFLVYGNVELKLENYIDYIFQSDVDDSKLTSIFVFKINGDVISWKKQDTTADSTTEIEYIVAAKESVWMRISFKS
ncbi:secreted RxLR effector protein 161-like [Primulina eburnea]|uniref:secreted RxLR effector protein 161-like n=1 Tax=Primulina eburnea TaxID=1245227 RepID=UPI003C6C9EEA